MIVTAAVVFAGLTILDALTVGYAVAGFIIVAAAAFLAMRAGQEVSPLARPVAVSEARATRCRRLSPACLIR